MLSAATKFLRDEEGASLVEYSVLIGLVAAATIALISAVGVKVYNTFSEIEEHMGNAGL